MTLAPERPADVEQVAPLVAAEADPPPAGPPADALAEAPQEDEASPLLTCASAALSGASAAVLAGGLFTGPAATLLGLGAVAVGAAGVALSYRLSRPGPLQWAILPLLLVIGAVAAAASDSGSSSRNPIDLAMSALRAGGIEQPPVPFDPGWRLLLVVLLGGWVAGAAMVATSWSLPKLAVFGPVPLTFGLLLLQPVDGGSVRTGAALALVVLALATGFGVDLGQQGVVSGSFQLRRMARGVAGLAVLLVALGGVTQLDFLFPPPKQVEVVPPQKPQLPPPEPDRVLFSVRSDAVLPWRLGTLDVYDGRDWLTPPFDRSRLQDVPADGAVPSATSVVPGRTVPVTFTLQDVRDRVIPSVAGARAVRRPDGFAVQSDPRTQVLRLPEELPSEGQTYTVDAPLPPSAAVLRKAPPPPAELAEFTEVPPAPPKVQALLDAAPQGNAYDRLQFVRASYYRNVVAAGAGKPVSTPPSRVEEMLAGQPGSPYEITAVEVLLARWAGVPARFGYGYYDGDKAASGAREIRPRHGATWLEAWFTGSGWVPLLGTPPKAQGSLSSSKNPNQTVRPSSDLALTVYVPVQQSSIRLFYELARYWAVRTLPWVLAVGLVLWAYPVVCKAVRSARRRRWAAARGPRERVAVAYLELRDTAADLNVGAPASTPLEFLGRIAPDDDHLELAWLVTRAVWGDLRRDCREADAVVAEETAASLARRLRGAQPPFNRVLAAVSRTSLRNPTSTEVPNFWWPQRRRRPLRSRLRAPRLRLPVLRPSAAASFVVAVLLLSGCAQEVPLQTGDRSGLPERTVPAELDGYRFVREKKAELSYVRAGRSALVEPGEVYTVHQGPNVQASVQVAPFKRGLLEAGRQRELKDSVLASLGSAALELKRIGDVTYRVQQLPDRRILVYLPEDTSYMVLVLARPAFEQADRLLGSLVAYQRGTSARPDRVAELPDPLRGIDT